MFTTVWTVAPLCKRDVRTLAMDSILHYTAQMSFLCLWTAAGTLPSHPTPWVRQVVAMGSYYLQTYCFNILFHWFLEKKIKKENLPEGQHKMQQKKLCAWQRVVRWWKWCLLLDCHENKLNQLLLLEQEISLWYMYYLKPFFFPRRLSLTNIWNWYGLLKLMLVIAT